MCVQVCPRSSEDAQVFLTGTLSLMETTFLSRFGDMDNPIFSPSAFR